MPMALAPPPLRAVRTLNHRDMLDSECREWTGKAESEWRRVLMGRRGLHRWRQPIGAHADLLIPWQIGKGARGARVLMLFVFAGPLSFGDGDDS